MAKPIRKIGGLTEKQLFELLKKANPSRLLSQYASANRPLEFPYAKSAPKVTGAGRIPSGAPINMPPPSYPQLGAGNIAEPFAGKFWQRPISKALLKSLGKGALAGARSPVGWGALAVGAATGGAELWKALTPDFQKYADSGGRMGQIEWQRSGRPKNPMESGEAITGYAAGAEERKKGRPTQKQRDEEEADRALQEMRMLNLKRGEAGWDVPIPGGAKEGEVITQADGSTGFWIRDIQSGGYPDFRVLTKGKQDKDGRELYTPYGTNPYDNPETEQEEGQFNPYTGEWEAPRGYISPQDQREIDRWEWDRTQREKELRSREEYEDRRLQWERDQWQMQLNAQKEERLARLKANPGSWLEYAALAGQTPVIQPWMLPLMPQQYASSQAGQAIPGGGQGEGGGMNLPGLVTPSAQYMSRISPSMRQQYYGYEQARTGATPEDTSWRLWSQAPPGGQYRGLRRIR